MNLLTEIVPVADEALLKTFFKRGKPDDTKIYTTNDV